MSRSRKLMRAALVALVVAVTTAAGCRTPTAPADVDRAAPAARGRTSDAATGDSVLRDTTGKAHQQPIWW